MAANALTVRLSVRWWVSWYVSALALFCQMTGARPDFDRVISFIVKRGVKIEPVRQ